MGSRAQIRLAVATTFVRSPGGSKAVPFVLSSLMLSLKPVVSYYPVPNMKRRQRTAQRDPELRRPFLDVYVDRNAASIVPARRHNGAFLERRPEALDDLSIQLIRPQMHIGLCQVCMSRSLGLGGSNPPRGDARWPRNDWPTKSAHCRGLPTGVSLSQTAIARIVRRRREFLPVCGLPIAMEEPPCPSPRPCKSTWIRASPTT